MISLHIMPTISTLGAYTNQAPHLEQFTLQNQILCGLHCLPLRMMSGELQYKHTICLDGAITRHYREFFSAHASRIFLHDQMRCRRVMVLEPKIHGITSTTLAGYGNLRFYICWRVVIQIETFPVWPGFDARPFWTACTIQSRC